jgi:hypothetical protein
MRIDSAREWNFGLLELFEGLQLVLCAFSVLDRRTIPRLNHEDFIPLGDGRFVILLDVELQSGLEQTVTLCFQRLTGFFEVCLCIFVLFILPQDLRKY